jgi:flagellar protein FliJ
MTDRRWLPVLMRARQAGEDARAQQVAAQRRDLAAAERSAGDEEARVDAMTQPESASRDIFLAGAAARAAAAATHAAARQRARFARDRLATGIVELSHAARDRRIVERLVERVETAERAEMLSRAQRESDDTVLARFKRAAGDGLS